MNNRAQTLVPMLNPFLPHLSHQDQRIFKLLQGLQTYPGPYLPNIVRGILAYWLALQPKTSSYSSLLRLTWIFGSKLTLSEVIQRELGVTEKTPLTAYQKLSYLTALLNYVLKNPDKEDFSLLAKDLSSQVQALLLHLDKPITQLLKKRPRAAALETNFSRLLTQSEEKREGAEFAHLAASVLRQVRLPGQKDTTLAYDATFGAVVYMMAKLDKKAAPHLYRACQDAINLDRLKELSSQEKLSIFSGLFYVLSKEASSGEQKKLQEYLIAYMNELLEEQHRCGSLRKLILFAVDNVEQVLAYYLNHSVRKGFKQVASYADLTISGVNYLGTVTSSFIGSALGFFSPPKLVDEESALAASSKEFLFTLAVLPDELFSQAKKRRLHNGFEIEIELALHNEEKEAGFDDEKSIFSVAPLSLPM